MVVILNRIELFVFYLIKAFFTLVRGGVRLFFINNIVKLEFYGVIRFALNFIYLLSVLEMESIVSFVV